MQNKISNLKIKFCYLLRTSQIFDNFQKGIEKTNSSSEVAIIVTKM